MERMKEIMQRKNRYINELEIKQKDLKMENAKLNVLVQDLEFEITELRLGNPAAANRRRNSRTKSPHRTQDGKF